MCTFLQHCKLHGLSLVKAQPAFPHDLVHLLMIQICSYDMKSYSSKSNSEHVWNILSIWHKISSCKYQRATNALNNFQKNVSSWHVTVMMMCRDETNERRPPSSQRRNHQVEWEHVRGRLPLIRWHHINILSAKSQQSCPFGDRVMALENIKQVHTLSNVLC